MSTMITTTVKLTPEQLTRIKASLDETNRLIDKELQYLEQHQRSSYLIYLRNHAAYLQKGIDTGELTFPAN